MTKKILPAFAVLLMGAHSWSADSCHSDSPSKDMEKFSDQVMQSLITDCDTVFPNLKDAITAQTQFRKPVKFIETKDTNYPNFPSYSQCEKSFFRMATIGKTVDEIISKDGWKSGWVRKEDELKKSGQKAEESKFDALPPSRPMEDRIVQYVRVKGVPSEFPKDSTVVGVLENPIRTLSVGYHTGYDSGMKGDHMRMDEIEVGPCAKSPECQKIQAYDSTEAFKKKGLIPRYSTEGEWAIDSQIPKECVVATYRIKFGKIDDKCYSDSNNNCKFESK